MKLIYLKSAAPDLRWFKHYYMNVFPEGRVRADQQFMVTQNLLKANPYLGQPSDFAESAREHHLPRTPFTFVYRVRDDRIEVLRVVDGRSDWRGLREAAIYSAAIR
jgi:plasmid stabilization system protein ParE